MEISSLGKANFKIKVKGGSVVTAEDSLAIFHKGETGKGFVIREPGEYEIEGISVFGYQADSGPIFVVQAEELRCLYLSKIDKSLPADLAGEIDNIDVVFLPTDQLGPKEMVEVVAKLEPYYILPYGESVQKFIAGFEHGSRSVKSLSLSKPTLPEDLTEVIVFE